MGSHLNPARVEDAAMWMRVIGRSVGLSFVLALVFTCLEAASYNMQHPEPVPFEWFMMLVGMVWAALLIVFFGVFLEGQRIKQRNSYQSQRSFRIR